jgi:hypothetical protein
VFPAATALENFKFNGVSVIGFPFTPHCVTVIQNITLWRKHISGIGGKVLFLPSLRKSLTISPKPYSWASRSKDEESRCDSWA